MINTWRTIEKDILVQRTGNPSLDYHYDIGELFGEPAIRVRRVWEIIGYGEQEEPEEYYGYIVLAEGGYVIPSRPPLYVMVYEDGEWDYFDYQPDDWPERNHGTNWLKYCKPREIHFYRGITRPWKGGQK